MKKKILAIAALVGAMGTTITAQAFTQPTHKQIAIDAVKYMERHPDTTNFNKLKSAATAAGFTVDQMANAIGQGSYDVDDFQDTFMCGAITGDCVRAPVFGLGAFVATYTAWWHFQNHTHGSDQHGNDLGGYDQRYMPKSDITDGALRTWLINDHLDDGPGGMTGTCVWVFGWRCAEDSEYNSYGITEKNYRLDTNSSPSMYEDFQTSPFQPIDNLGQYWYNQFLASPSFQTLGFSLHTTDLLQPHHVWVTSGRSHGGWESWVQDHYESGNFAADHKVTAAMGAYTPIPSNQKDIRPLLTQGGAIAYSQGGAVLNTTDHNERMRVANIVIPHAVAMVVHVLNHAADQFTTPEYRQLKNAKTGLCMDVAGANNSNGTNVQQWQCVAGVPQQLWKYEASTGFLRNKMGKCLDNTGNAANNGKVQIWDCVNSNNLRWDWVGNTLRSRHNNNIAVDAYGSGNGANIGQWTYHGGDNQRWNWQ